MHVKCQWMSVKPNIGRTTQVSPTISGADAAAADPVAGVVSIIISRQALLYWQMYSTCQVH